ncbi:MAG TPA: serine/threonine-protein kinase, partial [Thermoanaerobaculia bacterium]|nr:serine/threonine-protein kinase [Thermoanaerobaculia bacterium]
MERSRWNRIEEVLQNALDLEEDARNAYLCDACGDDDELRREVDALLQSEQAAELLSERPAIARFLPPVLHAGRTISHYRIEQRIGAGGMGEVYEARDEHLHRVVALKALPAAFTSDPERVRRFEQEAFAASRLNHPNIITIFEIVHEDGAHFIAAERVEGVTLRDVMQHEVPLDQALHVTMQVAAALEAAHTAWIIHRDIKPENVMLRADSLVKVLDFGIAKLSDEEDAPGTIVGTVRYMSPEQRRGEPLDGRTDLFSLGIVVHEMLTGARPGANGETSK